MSNLFIIPAEAMLQGLPTTMTAHKFVTVEWVLQTLNGGSNGPWSISEMAKLMVDPVWYGKPEGKKNPWVHKTTPGTNDKITAISSSSVQTIFANALGRMVDVLNINPTNEREIKVKAKKLHILAYALKHKFAGVAVVKIKGDSIEITPLNTALTTKVEVAADRPVAEGVASSPDMDVAVAPATIGLAQIVTPATEDEIAKAAQFAMRREKIVNGLSQSAFSDDELRLIVDEAIARRKKIIETVEPIKLVPNPTKVEIIIKEAKSQVARHYGWFVINNAGTLTDVKEAHRQLLANGRDIAYGIDPDDGSVWLCGVNTAKFELRGFETKPEHAQVVGKVVSKGVVKTVVILPAAA